VVKDSWTELPSLEIELKFRSKILQKVLKIASQFTSNSAGDENRNRCIDTWVEAAARGSKLS
jgi:hypothetical protein